MADLKLRIMVGLFSLFGAGAVAQTPPPLPLLPPLIPGPPQANGNGTQGALPPRRPVKGSMNGLLDYMANVDVAVHEEIDSPAVGYGNELLWEKSKSSSTLPSAPAAPTTKRQLRKSGDDHGSE